MVEAGVDGEIPMNELETLLHTDQSKASVTLSDDIRIKARPGIAND